MTDPKPLSEMELVELERLASRATPGPYRSMRDGNQYVETRYMLTARLVGASRIEGLQRPWNPHAAIAFGQPATEHETVRFKDGDADYFAALDPDTIRRLISMARK